ncbi:MAG: sigma-70 family RNA polymerase sigma factor [Deltaproteobacteria bacterium]|nr:sigma-70 family RNA polymerase sigma factor [Deltaproteobacteria bacterium]
MGPPRRTPSRSTVDPADDRALMRRVAKGDRQAAQRLAVRLLPTVKSIAVRMTRNPSDAQDATQEALVELLRSAPNYRGDGALEGWARRIALRSVARGLRRRATAPSGEPIAYEPVAAEASTFVTDRLPRPLDDYLSALTDTQRTAMLLRCSMGCTIPEIAELTNSPVPTVKSRVNRALEIIRGSIQRDIRFGARKEVGG